jgi:uncharacterized protein (DUF1330 family)
VGRSVEKSRQMGLIAAMVSLSSPPQPQMPLATALGGNLANPPMPAYIVARIEVTNRQQYSEYTKVTPAAIARYGGRFLARGGDTITLEGSPETRRVVILEFPTMERARAFYYSDEYQAAKRLRQGAATADFLAVDGCPAG